MSTVRTPAAFAGAAAVAATWLGFKELQPDSYRLLYTGRWIAQQRHPQSRRVHRRGERAPVRRPAMAGRAAPLRGLADCRVRRRGAAVGRRVCARLRAAGGGHPPARSLGRGVGRVRAAGPRRGAQPHLRARAEPRDPALGAHAVALPRASGDRATGSPSARRAAAADPVGEPARVGRPGRRDRGRVSAGARHDAAARPRSARRGLLRRSCARLSGLAACDPVRNARPHLLPEHVRQQRGRARGHRVGRARTRDAGIPSIPPSREPWRASRSRSRSGGDIDRRSCSRSPSR